MTNSRDFTPNIKSLISNWIKASADFAINSDETSDQSSLNEMKDMPGNNDDQGSLLYQINSIIELCKLLGHPFSDPKYYEEALSASGDIINAIAGTSTVTREIFSDCFELWKILAVNEVDQNKATPDKDPEKIQKNDFSETYRNRLEGLVKIFHLSLTRVQLQKIDLAMQTSEKFRETLTEFLICLLEPLEESIQNLGIKLKDRDNHKSGDKDDDQLYEIWIKVLENDYLNVLKSTEYSSALNKLINAAGNFAAARQEVMQEWLKFLPLPSIRDYDDLSKEVYLLKKRINSLEKQLEDKSAQCY